MQPRTTTCGAYLSQSARQISQRWKRHLIEAKLKRNSCRHLYSSMNRYGPNKFSIKCVERCLSENGDSREKYWIKNYNSMDRAIGYNLTEGGNNGQRSEEYKKRISETLKKYFQTHVHPPNPTIGKFGPLHHFYGKHHTNKTKQKLSDARKGKKYEDVMDIETASKSKEKHSQRWKGSFNPSFCEIPMEDILKQIHEFPLLTAQDISEKYHISYPTVIDKFKKFTGMTFEGYKKEKMGFNHGIYKRLRNLGLDKMTWLGYCSAEQHKLGCKL